MNARLGALLSLAVVAVAPSAHGYCRTTTCDPRDPSQACQVDPTTYCVLNGTPLHWPTSCVSFGVQSDGSVLRSIDYATADRTISAAYESWLGADCGNGTVPGIDIGDRGAISCDKPVYNQSGGNANVWMFRDDGWPYPDGADSTIALTTVTYNTENGEIYDADVELNSYNTPITVGDTNIQFDLQSIATHEAGHFLGLSHSLVAGSAMLFSYREGDTSLRAIGSDDVAAICATYPPGRVAPGQNCTPRHGFTSQCSADDSSCTVTTPGTRRHDSAPILVAALVGLCALARRGRAHRA